MTSKITWSDRTDAGSIKRPLGFHEGKKEILAGAHHHYHVAVGSSDRIDARLGGGAVYLYAFLEGCAKTGCEKPVLNRKAASTWKLRTGAGFLGFW